MLEKTEFNGIAKIKQFAPWVKTVICHSSGHYTVNGDFGVVKGDLFWNEIEAYLAEHPEALIPEPEPPKPTPEQIAEAKKRATLAQLDDLDRKSARYLRASIAGTIDEEGKKRLAAIEAEAKTLRASL